MSTQPSPWHLDGDIVRDAKGVCVLDVTDANMAIEDARLIAAAPELLDALKLCRQYMYDHASNTPDNAFEKLCAAITKATGEQT